jgi:hypothetical protein
MPARFQDVFFSYAHGTHRQLTDLLYTRLRKLGRPWYRLQALRIFRDTSTLPATEALWPTISAAIESSTHFLLVASEESSRSMWVEREVRHYLRVRERRGTAESGRLLIALVDGRIAWSDERCDFDWAETRGLSPSLAGVFRAEPLYVDLTDFAPPLARPARGRFDLAVARLAAGFRGVTPDEILSTDRNARRRLRWVVLAVVLLLSASLTGSLLAVAAAERRRASLDQQLAEREDASHVIKNEAVKFERIRHKPIRHLDIELRTDTIPHDGSALEVRITHDRLFSQPMRFFVAALREGQTWPPALRIPEPSGADFRCSSALFAGWFRWYQQEKELTETIPLAGDPWAYRSIDFDGSKFDPPEVLELPQTFELPSFSKLVDNHATVELLLHRPGKSDPEILAPDRASVHLEVRARFDDPEMQEFTLFRSVHTSAQQRVLTIDYLYSRPQLEKEALLTLYKPTEVPKSLAAVKPLHDRWKSGQPPRTTAERAIFAQLEVERGREEAWTSYGGGGVEALPHYLRALDDVAPVQDDDTSATALAALCWDAQASTDLAEIIKPHNRKKFSVLTNAVTRLERTLHACPECTQVRRWVADIRFYLAVAYAAENDRSSATAAADALRTGVAEATALDQQVHTDASAAELIDRVATAQKIAAQIPATSAPLAAEWRPALDQACPRLTSPRRSAKLPPPMAALCG